MFVQGRLAEWLKLLSICPISFFGLGSNLRLANIFFAIDDIMVEQDMSIGGYYDVSLTFITTLAVIDTRRVLYLTQKWPYSRFFIAGHLEMT